MSLIVREAKPEDGQGVADVLNPIVEEGRYTILDTTFSAQQEREFIENFPSRGVFHVAEDELSQVILGFQNVEPFASYTKALDHVGIIGTFVGENSRGQGVSSLLFDATFELAKRKGYRKLFAYVLATNQRALAVYQKQGFEVVGIAKQHAKIGDSFVDEVLIEKFL